MAYFLSYLVTQTRGDSTGHAFLALTEHTPPDLPRLICRVGLFASGQVKLEDFIRPKKGRTFFHKTYPITEEEMLKFLKKVNEDRSIKQDQKKFYWDGFDKKAKNLINLIF